MADKDKLSVPAARSIGPILSIVSEVLLLVNVLSELRGLVQETLSGFPVIIPDRLTWFSDWQTDKFVGPASTVISGIITISISALVLPQLLLFETWAIKFTEAKFKSSSTGV